MLRGEMRRPSRKRRAAGEHHHKQEELNDPPLPPALPPELVLEIVDRCDPATLIACAAASRPLSPAFIQRRRAAARGRFAPSSLLGLFYRHFEGERAPRPPPFTPASAATVVRTPFAPDVFDGFTPVESRGGLLVLRRSALFAERAGLCVYDPVTFLPPPEVHHHQQSYALLLGDDGGGGGDGWFRRLTVVDLSGLRFHHTVRAQSFSPDDDGGAWGPVIDAFAPDDGFARTEVARPSPVILGTGGVVLHWLCTDNRTVLTLHADTAEVGTVLLPPYHVYLRPCHCGLDQQLLASSPDGELSLLVARGLMINVWVRRSGWWTRRAAVDVGRIVLLVIRRPVVALTPPPMAGMWRSRSVMQMEWAGERSGAVVAQVPGVGLLVLDLEREEVVCTVQRSSSSGMEEVTMPFRYCPYERDLLARLPAMAPL